jgi:hypothetical protein
MTQGAGAAFGAATSEAKIGKLPKPIQLADSESM